MRWSNLSADAEERARLPGYKDEAVVRHFEAPGSIPTRFYEVRAKSILNRVPEQSRVPFRWTINPYRGCTHACQYCLAGETPVLTADGRHTPISELAVGNRIYGTIQSGQSRKYALTTVLDKWMTIKPAYRVVLDDGTELVASADHRFLSDRGWKHVLNTPPGEGDRAHLTTSSYLAGTTEFARQPRESSEYRRGYLCGVVRGDAHAASFSYERLGRSHRHGHVFRLASTGTEALRRARDYLAREEVATSERVYQRAAGDQREMLAFETASRSLVDRLGGLIDWPVAPTLDWCRGFLAGIFDAQGSRSALALTISSEDPQVIDRAESCATRLGLVVAQDRAKANSITSIRIPGGQAGHLRFFHLTDPAVTRKRSIEGETVSARANLKVATIEPLGRALALYDITTGTGDFVANGVVSHNCFARPTHRYLDFDAGRDFEREIVVKVNAPERLRVELAKPSWKLEHVALGTNTDPYQWVEGRYKLMRGIWEAMRDAANPCSVLTKSPLLLRDLDLMRELDERTDFSAALSVPTLDEKAWRATEPHTPNPKARLEAVKELTRNGIRTGVLVAPLMPGINDAPEQVEPILELAAEAGAAYVTGIALHLRGEVRDVFFDWLREHRPDLVPRYEELYARGAYMAPAERNRLAATVRGLRDDGEQPARGRLRAPEPPRKPRPASPAQRPLF